MSAAPSPIATARSFRSARLTTLPNSRSRPSTRALTRGFSHTDATFIHVFARLHPRLPSFGCEQLSSFLSRASMLKQRYACIREEDVV
eukprot:6209065-Pleurochrysis_carterae.AAC.5